jgi:pimeloyl-ACP methyl ester carboxylesterase
MKLRLMAAVLALTLSVAAAGEIRPFPKAFRVNDIAVNGTTIHVRVGGAGPAVVLLHGYGESGDMWASLAADLMARHTVVVPDIRGMGLSSKPKGGFTKMNQATDVASLLDALKIERADVVAHDVGNMVAFAFAAKYSSRVTKLVVIDAPIPGIGPWDDIVRSPLTWHFRFGGPDTERLVKGRERIYLDRFWNDFSVDPKTFSEASREHYARLFSMAGAMHSGFEQYRAFDQDVIDNRAWLEGHGKLKMPVLALGAEHGLGLQMAEIMRAGATNVMGGIIPRSGHWVMEENPTMTVHLVRAFLDY